MLFLHPVASGKKDNIGKDRLLLTQACLKIYYKDVEISTAFDNSSKPANLTNVLYRTDVKIYRGCDDLTRHIGYKKDDYQIHFGSIEDLIWIKKRIDRALKLGLI